MSSLALQRCWNHSSREAVARCPECERSFCRECVVEHEDRIICSACLAKLTAATEKPARRWSIRPVLHFVAAFLGLVAAWFLYFSLGRTLLATPDAFHAQSLWKRTIGDMMEYE